MNYQISRTQRVSTILVAIIIHALLLVLLLLVELEYMKSPPLHYRTHDTSAQVSFVPISSMPQKQIPSAQQHTVTATPPQSTQITSPQSQSNDQQETLNPLPVTASTPQEPTPSSLPDDPSSNQFPTPHSNRFLQKTSAYANMRFTQPRTTVEKKDNSSSKKSKKRMSLAQLAEGFSASMKKQNPARTKPNNKRTGDEIAMNIFSERVVEVLSRSMKRAAHLQQPSFRKLPRNCVVHLVLVLKKDGSVKYLGLEESSGDQAVDTYVVSRFNQCNDQFPPLPRSFKDPVAIFGFKIPLN